MATPDRDPEGTAVPALEGQLGVKAGAGQGSAVENGVGLQGQAGIQGRDGNEGLGGGEAAQQGVAEGLLGT
jgi:hypothetical protein